MIYVTLLIVKVSVFSKECTAYPVLRNFCNLHVKVIVLRLDYGGQ